MQTRSTDGTTRAKVVCRTCSARKKSCDKVFPTCGFCKKKNVACLYEIPLSKRDGGRYRKHQPGRNFVAISASPSPIALWDEVSLNLKGLWTAPLGNVTAWSPPTLASFFPPHHAIKENIHAYVLQVLQASDTTLFALGERYFRTFDTLIVTLSPEHFHQTVLSFKDTRTPPPLCHYTLMLAMLLAVGLPEQKCNSNTTVPLDRTSVYMTTKALAAQAQAVTDISLHLVQTVFLLAACEHLAGRPEVANVSLSSCVSMARVIQVDQVTTSAITLMERIILCELQSKNISPLTQLVATNPPTKTARNQSSPSLSIPPPQSQAEFDIHDPAHSSLIPAIQTANLASQTRLISLIDRILTFTRSPSLDLTNPNPEITQLDMEIQCFLGAELARYDESMQGASYSSPTVALTIRLIFLLHTAILDALDSCPQGAAETPSHDAEQQRIKSLASLDSACSMVMDAVRHRRCNDGITPTPVGCFYNAKAAVRHLRTRGDVGKLAGRRSDAENLAEAEGKYRRNWFFLSE